MFSRIDTEYRAGIIITHSNKTYRYSLEFFMEKFVAFSQDKAAALTPIDAKTIFDVEIKSTKDLWIASQSITKGEEKINNIDLSKKENSFNFILNERSILSPHHTNCYMIDEQLLASDSDFKKETSYLQLARYLLKNKELLNHQELAADTLTIMNGGAIRENDLNVKTLPLIIAILFIAEPNRNPSCFIPSLMLLDLILNAYISPFGVPYTWNNSLQNQQLVTQDFYDDASTTTKNQTNKSSEQSNGMFLFGHVYPQIAGIPGQTELRIQKEAQKEKQKPEKIPLSDNEKKFINAEKKHNFIKNQNEILPHEMLMQMGGYFPHSHRFSYTELQSKRAAKETTLSDKKSFILMCDWLTMIGVAEPIYQGYIGQYKYKKIIDIDENFLTTFIFPLLWKRMDGQPAFKSSIQMSNPQNKHANCVENIDESTEPLSDSFEEEFTDLDNDDDYHGEDKEDTTPVDKQVLLKKLNDLKSPYDENLLNMLLNLNSAQKSAAYQLIFTNLYLFKRFAVNYPSNAEFIISLSMQHPLSQELADVLLDKTNSAVMQSLSSAELFKLCQRSRSILKALVTDFPQLYNQMVQDRPFYEIAEMLLQIKEYEPKEWEATFSHAYQNLFKSIAHSSEREISLLSGMSRK